MVTYGRLTKVKKPDGLGTCTSHIGRICTPPNTSKSYRSIINISGLIYLATCKRVA